MTLDNSFLEFLPFINTQKTLSDHQLKPTLDIKLRMGSFTVRRDCLRHLMFVALRWQTCITIRMLKNTLVRWDVLVATGTGMFLGLIKKTSQGTPEFFFSSASS